MTEAEWLACTDSRQMLHFVWKQKRRSDTWRQRLLGWLGNKTVLISDRRLQMLVLAYCRRHLQFITDERDRKAVDLAGLYVEGHVGEQELREATQVCYTREALFAGEVPRPPLAYWVADACLNPPNGTGDPWDYECSRVEFALGAITTVVAHSAVQAPTLSEEILLKWKAVCASEFRAIAALLHDIVGNPFREVAVDPPSLAWNGGTVVKLARAIYDDRSFDRLPILADALEEAGCTNADMLNHCRLPGEHVPGCWVVDCLLNRS
jgi:hypothetical protein